MPLLDAEKLKENALTSIRLGIEDFQRSQIPFDQGGDPERALSAIRNLFAGVLLLFKYKIATSVDDPEHAATLIFNPPEVLPQADGHGGVEWQPVGNFKKTTIDVTTIKKRFDGFGIEMDWETIDKLQECRNHLEHLHPANTLGEVADFVAELFPILRDFVHSEMNEQPADLLGGAWPIMLKHHTFFIDTIKECAEAWTEAAVPKLIQPWLEKCQCEACGSSLIRPDSDDLDDGLQVDEDDITFRYECVACGYRDLIAPLIIKSLSNDFDYDPRDGGEPSVERCDECQRDTFVIHEQQCLWCEVELDYKECNVCEEPLRQDDQANGGLCGYHHHVYEKVMRED
ncbi:hypothetical protein [Methylophilus sp.]|uniref:hypothetical protein n=1 Tax=Methylophilus sp. TaxID=29541 RepID=UPI0011DBF24E|nr:hypothetical protein [Methylophilus sp.]TXI45042.1 MAG: hypothetical protein E6Q52_07350 [Methylophilus sp.]